MSEFKGTPGPWKVEKELSSRLSEWLITMDAGDRGRGIAIAETVPATGRELANARLIAEAPELLSLLKEARSTLEMWKDVAPAVSLCADIDKAVAKVTGDNP